MRFKIFENDNSIKHIVTEKNPNAGYGFSMALHTGEDKETILSNRLKLSEYFGDDCHYATALQTHSDVVHVIDTIDDRGWESGEGLVEADALITNLPNIALTVLTADCVPILLYDPISKAIGVVHAGWRGTQQRIVAKAISKMQELYGTKASDTIVGIGPSIGGCCYEVGSEVADNFSEYPESVSTNSNGKSQLDLKSINRAQLLDSGIKSVHMEVTPICTACQSDRFFSYRKEQGCSGRFVSALAMISTP